jgi:hypothetical protein
MADAMDSMFDLSNPAYDELLKDAAVDNRVGDHDAVIIKAVHDNWEPQYGGGPRSKLQFLLKTANDAKADVSWSPPPSPEEMAQKSTWDRKRVQGVAGAVTLGRQALQHYGKTPNQMQEGERYRIKTAKNKDGFIRVIAFLPRDAAVSNGSASGPKSPF